MRPTVWALLVLAMAAPAYADGEHGPMFGGSIIATHDSDLDVAGAGVELAWWYGRVGVGAEAARMWSADGTSPVQVGTLAASLRVLALRYDVPSLLDSRESVELGLELQGIVERAWWTDAPTERGAVSYGLGLAFRVRGATDDDRSNLLAESRLFVRAMRASVPEMDVAARESMPARGSGVVVIVGLGVLFGGGEPAYVDHLRRRMELDSEWIVR